MMIKVISFICAITLYSDLLLQSNCSRHYITYTTKVKEEIKWPFVHKETTREIKRINKKCNFASSPIEPNLF